jgi:hypothetical protein
MRAARSAEAAVTDPFAGLEPVAFWRHFEALTKIPRATFEEQAASVRAGDHRPPQARPRHALVGPRIEGPHARGERLHAGSAERFTRLLSALLDELSR